MPEINSRSPNLAMPFNPMQEKAASCKREGKSMKAYSVYVPRNGSHGNFFINVHNDWRDVNGFRVFEYFGDCCSKDDLEEMGKVREWYCANEVAPPDGFEPGFLGFLPKSKTL